MNMESKQVEINFYKEGDKWWAVVPESKHKTAASGSDVYRALGELLAVLYMKGACNSDELTEVGLPSIVFSVTVKDGGRAIGRIISRNRFNPLQIEAENILKSLTADLERTKQERAKTGMAAVLSKLISAGSVPASSTKYRVAFAEDHLTLRRGDLVTKEAKSHCHLVKVDDYTVHHLTDKHGNCIILCKEEDWV